MLERRFLLLQGPHGPFFHRLGRMLKAAGADVWRVGFNAGDRHFWKDRATFIPFKGKPEDWPDTLARLIDEKSITDIVLYGDTRPIHAEAVRQAKASGLTVHTFEEGYLRPYWVTYERNGTNGNSRLMTMSVSDMQRTLEATHLDMPEPPATWGDMRQHMFYGAVYHWHVLFRNRMFSNYKTHREDSVAREAWLYTRRLLTMPITAIHRRIAAARIKYSGNPYHLVLMQLEHDSSFQAHSPFNNMGEFIDLVMKGFAEGAPKHHHIVFKAHPLENERSPLSKQIDKAARRYGLQERVHFVRGGKLAKLLDHARTAVTVNSTAGQQVLWRGIPIKVFGAAVYDKPEFVSTLPIAQFFAHPGYPNNRAYRDYRRYLLETSQVPGGYYSARGRRQLMRQVADMMLDEHDPYEALEAGRTPPRQALRIV